jgi:hypothetical protein
MFKILVFFGRLFAWPRWHANSIILDALLVRVSLQRFPFGRAAFVFSFYYPECRMLKRVFRARAARAHGKSKIFGSQVCPRPPASREQGRALACVNKRCQTTNPKQHSGAKRSVSAAGG